MNDFFLSNNRDETQISKQINMSPAGRALFLAVRLNEIYKCNCHNTFAQLVPKSNSNRNCNLLQFS